MNVNLNEIVTLTMILFAVIDVIGSIPVLLELKKKIGEIDAKKSSIASFVIMVLFLILGEQMLLLIGIDNKSFAVAGSFVLFFLALEMILGIRIYKDNFPDSASIVPIAFPLIAGAGTLTTLISLKAQYQNLNIIIAIAINVCFVFLVLKNTTTIEKILGVGGINILRKVFGIILLAIAVKLFQNNFSLKLH